MFGIVFDGHPHLTRILLPPTWKGHPLRKDHPARATEMGPFQLPESRARRRRRRCASSPSAGDCASSDGADDFMFLNLGPQHPGTHGVLRIVLQLDGEEIVERGSRHRLSPPRRREDGRAPVVAHLHPLHRSRRLSRRRDEQPRRTCSPSRQLAGIEVPDRVKVIRDHAVRVVPHRQPSGLVRHLRAGSGRALAGVLHVHRPRARCSTSSRRSAAAACTRTGSASAASPRICRRAGTGWSRDFLDVSAARLREYDTLVMKNRIFKMRTQGVGAYTLDEAIEWGVTGPGPACLRPRLGFPQEATLLGLRPVRVRHSHGTAWRLLRPRGRARRGNAPEPAHHRAVPEEHAAGPVQVVASADHAAAQGADDARHRNADHAFPGRQLGTGDSAGRGPRRHRGHQGQQRLLPDERRQHHALSRRAFARRRSRTCR